MSEHQMKEALQKSSRKPQVTEKATPTPAEGTTDDLIRLQRLVGNQAVQRMLSDKTVAIHQHSGTTVQAKMTVGAADDAYEQEADSVAEQVMAKRDTIQRDGDEEEMQMKRVDSIQRAGPEEEELLQGKRISTIQRAEEEELLQGKRISTIQRAEEEELLQGKRISTIQRAEEEELLQGKRINTIQREGEEDELQMKRADHIQREGEEDELQMKRADHIQREEDEQPVDMSGSFEVGKDVEQQISAQSGGGQAIPDVNRQMFESTMGHDFSGVNVHTDSQSDNLNKEVGARAFTTGNDIFFRQGEYNPGSADGQKLLAHELTHVVQQGGAGVKAKADEE